MALRPPPAAAAAAIEAVDLQDADALDLLHRLDALAHDALDAVEQLAAEQRVARLVGQHVLGLVEQLLRLGLDRRADALGLGGDARLLGRLLGEQHLDGLAALGDLAVAHRDDALGRLGRARTRAFSASALAAEFFQRLLIERDRLVHQRRLDLLLAIDLELAQVALAADAGLVEAAVGGDARALDFLVGGDLGFLQRLDAGDFELLDRAPALEPGGFERLLARRRPLVSTSLAGDDFGLLDLPVGVDPLGALRGERDDALLVGDLDRLLLVDVEHFARLATRRCAPLRARARRDALRSMGRASIGRLDRLRAIRVRRPRSLAMRPRRPRSWAIGSRPCG